MSLEGQFDCGVGLNPPRSSLPLTQLCAHAALLIPHRIQRAMGLIPILQLIPIQLKCDFRGKSRLRLNIILRLRLRLTNRLRLRLRLIKRLRLRLRTEVAVEQEVEIVC